MLPHREKPAALARRLTASGPCPLVGGLLVLAPVVVMLALRLPLINQLSWADAWFYSGYAWVPKHHYAIFGLNYFAVRFPAVLSIGGFEKVFGAQVGYVLLRYALAVATSLALYTLARRITTRAVGLAAVALLLLNPFFTRQLLWDYSYFVAVSVGIVALVLWWGGEGRHASWTIAAGAGFSVATFSHATFATTLLVLGVIELVAALRGGRAATLAVMKRAGLALVGFALVYLAGFIAYRWLLGSVSFYDLLQPTIDFLRNNEAEVKPYVQPTQLWLWHEPRIWAPVVVSVALVAVLRREILGVDLAARVAQLCVGFTIFVWVYRFTVTSSFIEVWWSYNMTVVVTAPGTVVLLHALARRSGHQTRTLVIAVTTTAIVAVAIRNIPSVASDVYAWMTPRAWVGVTLLVVGVLAALVTAARRPSVGVIGLLAFSALTPLMTYATDRLDGRGGTGVFVGDGGRDWRGYRSGHRFAEFVRDHEGRNARTLLWYPSGAGYQDLSWVDLPQYGQTVQQLGANEPLTALRPLGAARLAQPLVTSVLVMSPVRGEVEAAKRALRAAGFRFRVADRGDFAGGRLPYAFLQLTRKP